MQADPKLAEFLELMGSKRKSVWKNDDAGAAASAGGPAGAGGAGAATLTLTLTLALALTLTLTLTRARRCGRLTRSRVEGRRD